jgi:hypothetical protein
MLRCTVGAFHRLPLTLYGTINDISCIVARRALSFSSSTITRGESHDHDGVSPYVSGSREELLFVSRAGEERQLLADLKSRYPRSLHRFIQAGYVHRYTLLFNLSQWLLYLTLCAIM